MFEFLKQKSAIFFDIKGALANFVKQYYTQRVEEGYIDPSWQEFSKNTEELGIHPDARLEDLIKLYTEDATRSYSALTAGNLVIFEYTSLKNIKKAYFAFIVGTKHGNGVYGNVNTKNTLMSCFLIDSGTDLNTLAAVTNVLHDIHSRKKDKTYQALENQVMNRGVREKAGVSKEGMQAIFPTTEFRTFRLNLGMETIYKVNLDG
tara:strand:+ start:53 stop:667 length:615 start_codon:yes stop_codon:yes gene_type:complete